MQRQEFVPPASMRADLSPCSPAALRWPCPEYARPSWAWMTARSRERDGSSLRIAVLRQLPAWSQSRRWRQAVPSWASAMAASNQNAQDGSGRDVPARASACRASSIAARLEAWSRARAYARAAPKAKMAVAPGRAVLTGALLGCLREGDGFLTLPSRTDLHRHEPENVGTASTVPGGMRRLEPGQPVPLGLAGIAVIEGPN